MAVERGEGWAVGHLDDLGDGPGFRKIRAELGVTEFGVNALVFPPGFTAPAHAHERQQEIYFVHRGTVEIRFADGTAHRLGPGGIARVDAQTVRSLGNVGEEDAVFVSVGGEGGYVGRDGRSVEGQPSPVDRS